MRTSLSLNYLSDWRVGNHVANPNCSIGGVREMRLRHRSTLSSIAILSAAKSRNILSDCRPISKTSKVLFMNTWIAYCIKISKNCSTGFVQRERERQTDIQTEGEIKF